MTDQIIIPLHHDFKDFVAGEVNADYKQRVRFEVWVDSTLTGGGTFEGQGKRKQMRNVLNQREHWSFGPISFTNSAELRVKITHFVGSKEKPSKMVGPLTINKAPESDYPMEFNKSTVVSDDSFGNQSHDDCTFVVLEYK